MCELDKHVGSIATTQEELHKVDTINILERTVVKEGVKVLARFDLVVILLERLQIILVTTLRPVSYTHLRAHET